MGIPPHCPRAPTSPNGSCKPGAVPWVVTQQPYNTSTSLHAKDALGADLTPNSTF